MTVSKLFHLWQFCIISVEHISWWRSKVCYSSLVLLTLLGHDGSELNVNHLTFLTGPDILEATTLLWFMSADHQIRFICGKFVPSFWFFQGFDSVCSLNRVPYVFISLFVVCLGYTTATSGRVEHGLKEDKLILKQIHDFLFLVVSVDPE